MLKSQRKHFTNSCHQRNNMDFTFLLIIITLVSGIFYLIQRISSLHGMLFDIAEFFSSIFIILFIVLFIRSFIIEPFRIPSGSMIPTLLIGDFILVNKYEYGLRLPLTNQILIENNNPDYGDVIVFQYPENKKINYIKRVVGLPGDSIEYINKTIFINGKEIHRDITSKDHKISVDSKFIYTEKNGTREYDVLINPNIGNNFSYRIPQDNYFVLGDNRDNSNDSRYWGPVHKNNLIGEAFMIWMYWNPSSNISISDRFGENID